MAVGCIFCKIGAGEVPSEFLYRDERCFAIRDIAPRAPFHLLVVPASHFVLETDLSESSEPLVGHLLLVARGLARSHGIAGAGYRVAVNQGENAGQTVDHLHVHVLGGRPLGPEG